MPKCTGCSFNIFLQLAYLRDSRSKLSKLPIQQRNVHMDGNMVLKTCSKPVQGGKPDRKPMKTSFWWSLVFNQTRLKDGWLLWCLWCLWCLWLLWLLWLLRLLWLLWLWWLWPWWWWCLCLCLWLCLCLCLYLCFFLLLLLLLLLTLLTIMWLSMIIAIRTSENQPWWGLAESSYTISPLVWFLVPLYCHYCITVESLQITVFMSSWYLIIFAWLYPITPLVKITIIITLISPESMVVNGGSSHYISNFDSCS